MPREQKKQQQAAAKVAERPHPKPLEKTIIPHVRVVCEHCLSWNIDNRGSRVQPGSTIRLRSYYCNSCKNWFTTEEDESKKPDPDSGTKALDSPREG